MTDQPKPGYHGDPEGLLPPEVKVTDEYTVWITGLTPEQHKAIVAAFRPVGRSLLGVIARYSIGLAAVMVIVASLLWLVAAIVTTLPTD